MSAYAPHAAYVAPARASAQPWRLLVGSIVALFIYLGLLNAMFAIAAVMAPEDAYYTFVADVQSGQSPFGMLFLLFTFAFMTLGVMVSMQLVHERRFSSVFGPMVPAMLDFWRVGRVVAAIYLALLILPPWGGLDRVNPGVPLALWLLLLPLSLLGVFIQASAEEIVFRGYLQQQLGARFASPLIWMVIPSMVFGLAHYSQVDFGENAWLIALWATLFGMMMADLTARTGTLGAAIAVHLVNNVAALLVVSVPGPFSGLGLFILDIDMGDPRALRGLLPVDFMLILVSWLAARVALRR